MQRCANVDATKDEGCKNFAEMQILFFVEDGGCFESIVLREFTALPLQILPKRKTRHIHHFRDKENAGVQVKLECGRFAVGDVIVIFKGNSEFQSCVSGFG